MMFSLSRNANLVIEEGYVEYIIILQHRSSWQDISSLRSSMAEVQMFCLELSKKLDMRYIRPPMPINLQWKNGAAVNYQQEDDPYHENFASLTASSLEIQEIMNLFTRSKK